MAVASFYDYGLQTVRADLRQALTDYTISAKNYFDGDHWQTGEGWIGPFPEVNTNEPEAVALIVTLEEGFVSENVVREVVERHRNGVVGTEPNWYLTPIEPLAEGEEISKEMATKIKEASAIVSDWWDRRKVLNLLQDVVDRRLFGGSGTMRLFVPRGKVGDLGEVVNVTPGKGARRYVFAEAPEIGDAAIVLNLETYDTAAVYTWKEGSRDYAEVSFLTNPDEDESKTLVRTFGPDGSRKGGLMFEYEADLGGEILLFEMKGKPIITPQVIQNQKVVNLARTMMKENVIFGGFLQTVITNASVPGKWEMVDGKRKFIPDSFVLSPGVVSFVQSQTVTDQDGNERALPTSINYKEPVPVTTFTDTRDSAKEAILSEVKQLHSLAKGDGAASGEARKQARYDFLKSLLSTKPEVDGLVRWVVTLVLEFEAAFTGRSGYFRDLRVVSDIKVNAGPLSADEKTEIRADRDAGLISEQTAMALLGVDDVDAEAAQIDEESKRKPKDLNALAKLGYVLDPPKQFPAIDASQGFVERTEADLQAAEDEAANQAALAAAALSRTNDPANTKDNNDPEPSPADPNA